MPKIKTKYITSVIFGTIIFGMAGSGIVLTFGNTIADCSNLDGYNTTTPEDSTGQAMECITSNETNHKFMITFVVGITIISLIGLIGILDCYYPLI